MLMSGERLLESREDGMKRKEEVYQEYTGVKSIPFKMDCYLPPLSLLPVYIVITSWISQGLYLCWAVFVQFLHLT